MFKWLYKWLIVEYALCYWSGAASIAGSVLGGVMGDDAASSAADAQTQASQAAVAEQKRQYDTNRNDLAPYRQTGTAGLNKLAGLLGIGPNGTQGTAAVPAGYGALTEAQWNAQNPQSSAPDQRYLQNYGFSGVQARRQAQNSAGANNGYQQYLNNYNASHPAVAATSGSGPSSDYGSLLKKFDQNDLNNDLVYQNGLQFGLDQGTQAIENRARASGSSDSGSVLKALLQYGNDYATTKTNDAYNRYTNDNTNIYNKLAGISGIGQNATNAGVQAGANSTNNISNLLTDQGNARSAGIIGGANAIGGAIGNIANQNWGNLMGNNSNYGNAYGYGNTSSAGPTQYQI